MRERLIIKVPLQGNYQINNIFVFAGHLQRGVHKVTHLDGGGCLNSIFQSASQLDPIVHQFPHYFVVTVHENALQVLLVHRDHHNVVANVAYHLKDSLVVIYLDTCLQSCLQQRLNNFTNACFSQLMN